MVGALAARNSERAAPEGMQTMELLIVGAIVIGLLAVFGRLAWVYPVDSRDLIDGSVVRGHTSPAPLWPSGRAG